jgi:histidine ammonia-lyase
MSAPGTIRAVVLGAGPLPAAAVVAVARGDAPVELAPAALEAIAASRQIVEELAAGDVPTYGISTGFGALATRHIDRGQRARLQRGLIR